MSDHEVIPAGATPISTPQLRVAASAPDPLSMLRSFVDQPAFRRSLPALGGAGALLMAGAAWWAIQSPNQTPLYAGLTDGDKASVADALQAAGIPYSIDRDTGSIDVGEDDVHKARMMLAGQGLPKAAPGGDTVLSTLPMGASRALEGETLRGAREADLARTIEAIDSVKSARIHLATPEPSPFVRDDSAPAASVMLTMEGSRSLSNAQVGAIKHLVASSVPGLSPAEVSVVDQSGALLSQDDGGTDDKNFQLQLKVEERYRAARTNVGRGEFQHRSPCRCGLLRKPVHARILSQGRSRFAPGGRQQIDKRRDRNSGCRNSGRLVQQGSTGNAGCRCSGRRPDDCRAKRTDEDGRNRRNLFAQF